MNTLETAMNWLHQGIAVIPVWYRSKKPAIKSWIEYQSQLPTEEQVTEWFNHKMRNLAIITGWQGLTVIDFDNFDIYSEWLQWATQGVASLVALYGMSVVTSRGVHVYIKCPNAHNMKLQGIDIKACGGYVLAPPSVHPSGLPYTWLNEGQIIEVDDLGELIPDSWIQPNNTEQTTVQIVDPWEMAATRSATIGMGAISRIKERVKITDIIKAEKSSRPGWYKTRCPFHQDTEPSFWINEEAGYCGCYACGGKPMDVVNLYARLNGVDNRTAIAALAER